MTWHNFLLGHIPHWVEGLVWGGEQCQLSPSTWYSPLAGGGGGDFSSWPAPSWPHFLPCCPPAQQQQPWTGLGRLSLCQGQIATQRTSLRHVCCELHHAFPVSAQHLSSLGRHEIAEHPIRSGLDPPGPVDPPSRAMHGTLNFNPAVPFVWKGETIYEESYKINTESSP